MLEIILPRSCIHCSRKCDVLPRPAPDRSLSKYLCPNCLKAIDALPRPTVGDVENILARFILEIEYPPIAAYEFIVDGQIQSVVHAMKYQGMIKLARTMGERLAERIQGDLPALDLVIPVPLHRTRFAERGFNQAEELATGVASQLRLPKPHSKFFRRTRPTKTQTQLHVEERLKNVEGVFELTNAGAKELKGKRLLLIDDVATTGSTLTSLARTAKRAEPRSITVATLAVAVRA